MTTWNVTLLRSGQSVLLLNHLANSIKLSKNIVGWREFKFVQMREGGQGLGQFLVLQVDECLHTQRIKESVNNVNCTF